MAVKDLLLAPGMYFEKGIQKELHIRSKVYIYVCGPSQLEMHLGGRCDLKSEK